MSIWFAGYEKPNYMPEDIEKAVDLRRKRNFPSIMVDCSHGNLKTMKNSPWY
jgi:phospho-2-dehydro-3-deoxyheptonate aldolase